MGKKRAKQSTWDPRLSELYNKYYRKAEEILKEEVKVNTCSNLSSSRRDLVKVFDISSKKYLMMDLDVYAFFDAVSNYIEKSQPGLFGKKKSKPSFSGLKKTIKVEAFGFCSYKIYFNEKAKDVLDKLGIEYSNIRDKNLNVVLTKKIFDFNKKLERIYNCILDTINLIDKKKEWEECYQNRISRGVSKRDARDFCSHINWEGIDCKEENPFVENLIGIKIDEIGPEDYDYYISALHDYYSHLGDIVSSLRYLIKKSNKEGLLVDYGNHPLVEGSPSILSLEGIKESFFSSLLQEVEDMTGLTFLYSSPKESKTNIGIKITGVGVEGQVDEKLAKKVKSVLKEDNKIIIGTINQLKDRRLADKDITFTVLDAPKGSIYYDYIKAIVKKKDRSPNGYIIIDFPVKKGIRINDTNIYDYLKDYGKPFLIKRVEKKLSRWNKEKEEFEDYTDVREEEKEFNISNDRRVLLAIPVEEDDFRFWACIPYENMK